MKCLTCRSDNPAQKKFCRSCGAELSPHCARCGSEVLPDDRFCGDCGNDLSLPSGEPAARPFDDKLERLQRFLPKNLVDKVLAQRDKIEGERKQVTVMFCDMEGFTALTDRLGPEGAYRVMDRVYEILISSVHEYEGTVNEMTGDGIMALFGAPIALEDAPQRAIRSAHAIHREMARFNDSLAQEHRGVPPLKMRAGIHTGTVVVGTLGSDLRVEFKAVGDTVNVASRMEGLAAPGTTYVTGETFRLTEGLFRFEELGARHVKGRARPVQIYRVIAPSTRRTRFDVTAERGLTPFVGRERELELLLDGFERARTGKGQAFSIVAEAGVGKSRLLYELRKALAGESVTFGEGRCLSYSRSVAYHPLMDIVRPYFGIEESDKDVQTREKVRQGLINLQLDEASTLPYFLELLSVKDPGPGDAPMSPDARRARIIDALRRFAVRLSEVRPLVMMFEDLHWMDNSSEEAAKTLLDSIAGERILLILTYRPEFVHTWGARSYHSQVNLNRLSNRESLVMASHLLGTDELDPALAELLLEKTEGVPFFIEELLRSLKDLQVLGKEGRAYRLARDLDAVTIPSTIQDVIMARVDSMPEGAKDLLRTASVIDREFSYDLIRRVADLPEQELLTDLSALRDAELIRERGVYPGSTYVFRHALTRELLYNSILTEKRRELHDRIGRAIEDSPGQNIEQQYGVLAEHFVASGDFERGVRYSKAASRKALAKGSYLDAIEYCRKRVVCVESLSPSDETQRSLIDARTLLASFYTSLSRLVEAREAVAPIAELAQQLDYKRKLPGIHMAIGAHSLFVEEDIPTGFRHLEQVAEIADEIDEGVAVYMPLWFSSYHLGLSLTLNCEFERGLRYLEKCGALSGSVKDMTGLAFAKAIAGVNHILRGDLAVAHRACGESLRMAEETGGLLARAMAHTAYGTACYFQGLFEESETHLLTGLECGERITQMILVYWAPFWLGHLYTETGQLDKADEYFRKGIESLESCGILPSLINAFQVARTRSRVLGGARHVSPGELLENQRKNRFKAFEGVIARYIGQILLSIDDERMPEAERYLRSAINADSSANMRWFLASDHVALAGLLARRGETVEAKQHLEIAIASYRECSASGWVERTQKKLATLAAG